MTELSSELNINKRLPPELLTRIFQFLPYSDLNNVLRWRELGEKPILWTSLKLKFNAFKEEDKEDEEEEEDKEDKEDKEDEEGEEEEEEDSDREDAQRHIRGWTDELALVLTMERLQSLENLTLDFDDMDRISWQDCMQFLLVVHHFAPSVKKLSWRESTVTVTPNPTPVVFLAQQLVEMLVKFKEVHFSSSTSNLDTYSFDEDPLRFAFFREVPPRFGNGINSAILRALTAAFDAEDSELKELTLHCPGFYDPAALAEARKKLTVNMI